MTFEEKTPIAAILSVIVICTLVCTAVMIYGGNTIEHLPFTTHGIDFINNSGLDIQANISRIDVYITKDVADFNDYDAISILTRNNATSDTIQAFDCDDIEYRFYNSIPGMSTAVMTEINDAKILEYHVVIQVQFFAVYLPFYATYLPGFAEILPGDYTTIRFYLA